MIASVLLLLLLLLVVSSTTNGAGADGGVDGVDAIVSVDCCCD